jgi:K+ transporter
VHCIFCKTGTEAMFADLGLFNVRAIQVIEHCYFSALHFSECMQTQTTNPIDYHKL